MLLLASTIFIHAQIKAVTETGDEVFLYQDGTWKYLAETGATDESESKTNETVFTRDKASTFLIKSKRANVGVWINTKIWSFTNNSTNEDAEIQFEKRTGDIYAMLITEKIQIPLESFKSIALQNAKNAAPDIKIIKDEYRNVNGKKVLMLQMSGTVQGIKVVYFGYYYSSEKGTTQLISYTGENLFKAHMTEMEVLLNGLVETE
jgi:hypothetical protein